MNTRVMESCKEINFYELMEQFQPGFFLELFTVANKIFRDNPADLSQDEEQTRYAHAFGLVDDLLGYCDRFYLDASKSTAEDLALRINRRPWNLKELQFLAGQLQGRMYDQLRSRLFFWLTLKEQALFQKPCKGWEEVIGRFPEAQEDIEEMNKCYAVERYTASIFHSLLVVEHGLIRLGQKIGVTDPKAGWDATYKQLRRILDDRSLVPTETDFNFIEQTKVRLDSMKHAWRNKVNHAAGHLAIEHRGFSPAIAEEIIMACRSFMRYMAEHTADLRAHA